MAKRKEDTPSPGSPAWMATFSDLMNLLLCFFVMLFSMSSVSEEKYQELVAGMSNSVSIFDGGATAIGDGVLISNGVSQLNELDKYINSMGKSEDGVSESDKTEEFPESGESLEEMLEEQYLQENEVMAETMEEAVAEGGMTEQIDVSFNSQYVQLTMKGALLFDSGQAEVKEDALKVLEKVGAILERYANGTIEIEGHTDNIPISSSQYANNEELSSARALSVFYYLTENTTINPTCLRHAGMGERVPVADNATEEGRSKNRRVEIKIYGSY